MFIFQLTDESSALGWTEASATIAGSVERGFHNGCVSLAHPDIGDAKTALFDGGPAGFYQDGSLLVVNLGFPIVPSTLSSLDLCAAQDHPGW